MTRGARECLRVLKAFLHGKDHCWPRQKTIGLRMKPPRSVRSVATYLQELTEQNCITTKRVPNHSNIYTIAGYIAEPVAEPVAEPPNNLNEFKNARAQGLRPKHNPTPRPAEFDYIGRVIRAAEVSRPVPISPEDLDYYREARRLYPMATRANLDECVNEMKSIQIERKPPGIATGATTKTDRSATLAPEWKESVR